jgi:hypothetical protein
MTGKPEVMGSSVRLVPTNAHGAWCQAFPDTHLILNANCRQVCTRVANRVNKPTRTNPGSLWGSARARSQTETTENEDFLPALDDKRGLVVDAILFTDLL